MHHNVYSHEVSKQSTILAASNPFNNVAFLDLRIGTAVISQFP